MFVALYITAVSVAAVAFVLHSVHLRGQTLRARAARRVRAAEHHAVVDFPDASEGRVIGRIEGAGESLRAPLSQRDCVAYWVRVQKQRGRGEWESLLEASAAAELSIDDGTGRASVRAAKPTLVLDVDHEDQSDGLCPASPRARALLAEHGLSPEGSALWYQEAILCAGERVAVLGRGSWEVPDDPSALGAQGYRELPRRLVLRELADGQVILCHDARR